MYIGSAVDSRIGVSKFASLVTMMQPQDWRLDLGMVFGRSRPRTPCSCGHSKLSSKQRPSSPGMTYACKAVHSATWRRVQPKATISNELQLLKKKNTVGLGGGVGIRKSVSSPMALAAKTGPE